MKLCGEIRTGEGMSVGHYREDQISVARDRLKVRNFLGFGHYVEQTFTTDLNCINNHVMSPRKYSFL